MKPLTVYKASAGSGKTFTLAVEYIKLLIDNPFCFRNILAVTFTNKATEEMKLRILSQLYGIWKGLPDSGIYIKTICGSLDITPQQASRQAGIALNHLIHNYHYFMVETIDAFFQSVLRNLARELDLTANLKIGLNDYQVEEEAVDQLIESLSTTSVMLQWLINYIFSNISDNKSWNIIGQVKRFGQTIFKDFYRSSSNGLNETISQPNFFDEYTKQLRAIRYEAKEHMAKYADLFEKETAAAGLTPTSYAKKSSGISSYFKKLKSDDFSDSKCKNQTLDKCLADPANWTSKTSPDRDIIISLVNDKLMNLLRDAESDRTKCWLLFSTADCTLRHLDKLRLLNGIETKVRQLNNEANRFLLSDTQFLLHTLIKDSDSPFIFEKAGCRLEHIMIDEFQDTSSIQWQNFKVLLKECMSHRNDGYNTTVNNNALTHNLIVGDVKQSIYRWRAGDWRLLNNIEAQFDNPESNIEIRNLQTNYRSEKNIIEFNNCFFKIASQVEYEQELDINGEERSKELLAAYSDVCQSSRQDKQERGLVKITLLPNADYEENMLANIDDTVQYLLASGISPNDIAILIRYNRHIPIIADYLMEKHPELKIVSDEAFRLDSSLAVNIIVWALSLIVHPDDNLVKANLIAAYQKDVLQSDMGISEMLAGFTPDNDTSDMMLPKAFVENIERLSRLPLFETVEFIFIAFNLSKLVGQSAYICAFYDQISEFVNNYAGNINKFLEEWNENIHSKTIQSSEINGIRITSIHKSKGLEFKSVIIPFCDWALENSDTMLWCEPSMSPFNDIPLVPVDYNKKLLETIYADDYRNEHIQNRVDNLNLLYVAFTRAEKNLFVFGRKSMPKGGKGCRSELILKCIDKLKYELKNARIEGFDVDETTSEAPAIFEYGSLSKDDYNDKTTCSTNVFLSPITQQEIAIEPSQYPAEFRQSNKSRDFIENKGVDDERERYIKTGNVLHKLFSTIKSRDDVEKVLREFETEGILYDDFITSDKLKALLVQRLSDNKISDWFDSRWQVFNECSILAFDKNTNKVVERRPDRVITDGNITKVIDFKFGTHKEEYINQVKQYMQLLISMGYTNIQGFLWYVYSNKVVEVKL